MAWFTEFVRDRLDNVVDGLIATIFVGALVALGLDLFGPLIH